MTTPRQPDRTESARIHDDHELIEGQEGAPGSAHRAGGGTAREVGTRDEIRQTLDPEGPRTSATKSNEVQPRTNTRSDHEGAQR